VPLKAHGSLCRVLRGGGACIPGVSEMPEVAEGTRRGIFEETAVEEIESGK